MAASKMTWERVSRHPLLPWVLGILVGAAICSGYVFSHSLRRVWQSHYPGLVERYWVNNGSFTLLSSYGSELELDEMVAAARTNEASKRLRTFDPYIKENHSMRFS